MRRHLKRLGLAAAFGVGLLALIQVVPYRVTNPPVVREPNWDSPRTRALAVAACFDCHSNQVRTPWYGHIAPISWVVTNHVQSGRDALNFSNWTGRGGEGADDAVESVTGGSMPPSYYTWFGLHAAARMTPAERQQLAQGLQATFARAGVRP